MIQEDFQAFRPAAVVALASTVAGPNPVLAADTIMIRCRASSESKVGELEVTTLFDGVAVVTRIGYREPKATIDAVPTAGHEVPRLLDAGDAGFLVNTGKHLVLVDTGGGTVVRRGKSRSFWRQPASLRLRIRKGRPRFRDAPPLRPYRRPHL